MSFFRAGRRRFLVLGLLVLVLIVGFSLLRGRVQAVPMVEVQPVTKSDLTISVQARGVMEAADPVDIRSPFSGQLLQVPLQAGAAVTAGDLLAAYRIDDLTVQEERLVRDLAQAEAALQDLLQRKEESDALGEAQLAQAEAQYEQARMDWVAAQTLPPWDPDRARTEQRFKAAEGALAEAKARIAAGVAGPADEAAARAAVTAAREALAQVREQKSQVELRSPAAGTLLQVEVDAGESVMAGQLLMRLADLSTVEVVAEVDEVDIGQVRPSAAAEVTVPAYPEATFEGEVVRVAPTARREGNVAHFDVWVRVPNPDHLLRPGMSALITIAGDRRSDVVVLPLAALTVRDGVSGVFVLEGQTARFQAVETGLVSATEAEVVDGVAEGDTVVVGPPPILRALQDGTPVQPMPLGEEGP